MGILFIASCGFIWGGFAGAAWSVIGAYAVIFVLALIP